MIGNNREERSEGHKDGAAVPSRVNGHDVEANKLYSELREEETGLSYLQDTSCQETC